MTAEENERQYANETTPDAVIDDNLSDFELAALLEISQRTNTPLRAIREMRYVATRFPQETRHPEIEWAAYALLAHREDRHSILQMLQAQSGQVTGELVRRWLAADVAISVIDGQCRGKSAWTI